MGFLNSLHMTAWQWVLLISAAFLTGFSKTGISGVTMLVVPIIAGIFGGRESTGMLLPMLIAGDVFAVCHYNRHAEWSKIIKPLPWAIAGLLAGALVGKYISSSQFAALIAIIVLVCVFILLYMEKRGDRINIPSKLWFFALAGMASGFASMIGNVAGPIFSVYLLSMGFKKNDFMGTFSWFFFIINLTKLPLQVFYWHNITTDLLAAAGLMIPAIAAGALLGIYVIRKFNDKVFRYVIIAMTAVAAVRLLL